MLSTMPGLHLHTVTSFTQSDLPAKTKPRNGLQTNFKLLPDFIIFCAVPFNRSHVRSYAVERLHAVEQGPVPIRQTCDLPPRTHCKSRCLGGRDRISPVTLGVRKQERTMLALYTEFEYMVFPCAVTQPSPRLCKSRGLEFSLAGKEAWQKQYLLPINQS